MEALSVPLHPTSEALAQAAVQPGLPDLLWVPPARVKCLPAWEPSAGLWVLAHFQRIALRKPGPAVLCPVLSLNLRFSDKAAILA